MSLGPLYNLLLCVCVGASLCLETFLHYTFVNDVHYWTLTNEYKAPINSRQYGSRNKSFEKASVHEIRNYLIIIY